MRISDWSSDVCSSDLHAVRHWQQIAQNDGLGTGAMPAAGPLFGDAHRGELRWLTPAEAALGAPAEDHAGGALVVAGYCRHADAASGIASGEGSVLAHWWVSEVSVTMYKKH